MNKENFFLLGTILKSHGISGAMVLKIEIDFLENLIDKLESIFIEINEQLIPFFISDIEYISEVTAIVKFDDIENDTAVKKFMGFDVYLPTENIPASTTINSNYNFLKGFHIIDSEKGDLGEINEVLHYSLNTILQVLNNGKEILIPATEHIINQIDQNNKTIQITAPKGLIEIYL